MSEIIAGEALTAQLNADHEQSKRFMRIVGNTILPAYMEWTAEHAWEEIEVPDPITIPPIWKALKKSGSDTPYYQQFEMDHDKFDSLALELGLDLTDSSKTREVLDGGISVVWENATKTALLGLTSNDLVYEDDQEVHVAHTSLFAGEPLLDCPPNSSRRFPGLGEVTLTNMGYGDAEGYHTLQLARARSLKVAALLFREPLAALEKEYPEEIKRLSRSIYVDDEVSAGDQGYVLLHTVLEGIMSTGQIVNSLVQPGIDQNTLYPVIDLSKAILEARLPVTFSSLYLNSDIGPEHMAGVAVNGLIVSQGSSVALRPGVFQSLRNRQRNHHAMLTSITGDELIYLQDPAFQAVNRSQGCPAGSVVQLANYILLDSVKAASES